MDYMHPWRDVRPWKRHSLALLAGGLIYIVLGISYMTIEMVPTNRAGLHVVLKWMDIQNWGAVFVFVGILAIVSSRWPPVSETWGYTLLTALSAGWSMTYLLGVWFYDTSLSNLRGVISFGLLAFMWWVISGLQNPEDVSYLLAKADALQKENEILLAKLALLEPRTE